MCCVETGLLLRTKKSLKHLTAPSITRHRWWVTQYSPPMRQTSFLCRSQSNTGPHSEQENKAKRGWQLGLRGMSYMWRFSNILLNFFANIFFWEFSLQNFCCFLAALVKDSTDCWLVQLILTKPPTFKTWWWSNWVKQTRAVWKQCSRANCIRNTFKLCSKAEQKFSNTFWPTSWCKGEMKEQSPPFHQTWCSDLPLMLHSDLTTSLIIATSVAQYCSITCATTAFEISLKCMCFSVSFLSLSRCQFYAGLSLGTAASLR